MVSLVALCPAQDEGKKEWGIQCGAERTEKRIKKTGCPPSFLYYMNYDLILQLSAQLRYSRCRMKVHR